MSFTFSTCASRGSASRIGLLLCWAAALASTSGCNSRCPAGTRPTGDFCLPAIFGPDRENDLDSSGSDGGGIPPGTSEGGTVASGVPLYFETTTEVAATGSCIPITIRHGEPGAPTAPEETVQVQLGLGAYGALYTDADCSDVAPAIVLPDDGDGSAALFYRPQLPDGVVVESIDVASLLNGSQEGASGGTLEVRRRATHVTGGSVHTCAAHEGVGVQCWGLNGAHTGTIGKVGITFRYHADFEPTPRRVSGIESFQTIAKLDTGRGFGAKLNCILADGEVWCWGSFGQRDGATQSNAASRVTGLGPNASDLAVGDEHACAVSDGSVYCWGANHEGQLGDGTTYNRHAPVPVLGLPRGVTAVAAGSAYTCAIVENGAVHCWGANASGQLGDGSTERRLSPVEVNLAGPITSIAADSKRTCASGPAGVQCWGHDETVPGSPLRIDGGVSALAITYAHACVLVAHRPYCWGTNRDGRLGRPDLDWSPTPVAVAGLSDSPVTAITTGETHTCLIQDGLVYCFGANEIPRLGTDDVRMLRPTLLAGLDNVELIAGSLTGSALNTACAVASGDLYCWGDETYRNLLGQEHGGAPQLPARITGLGSAAEISHVALGPTTACAVVDSQVRCWGRNEYALLGLPSNILHAEVPVAVALGTSGDAEDVCVGEQHACAIVDGGVRCWGSDDRGQLGDAAEHTGHVTAPVEVEGLGAQSGARALTCSAFATCVLVDDEVRCWGSNARGELVANLPSGSSPPVALAGGEHGFCALLENGSVRCWGWSGHGDGQGAIPAQPPGLNRDVTQLAGAGNSMCALQAGTLRCWGENWEGQLGNGTLTASEPTPVAVQGLVGTVRTFALGGHGRTGFGCARDDEGLKCWGSNVARTVDPTQPRNRYIPTRILPWEQP